MFGPEGSIIQHCSPFVPFGPGPREVLFSCKFRTGNARHLLHVCYRSSARKLPQKSTMHNLVNLQRRPDEGKNPQEYEMPRVPPRSISLSSLQSNTDCARGKKRSDRCQDGLQAAALRICKFRRREGETKKVIMADNLRTINRLQYI